MAKVWKIEDFEDLALYCRENPKPGGCLKKMIGELAEKARSHPAAQTPEGFVRLLYHMDSEMEIPAEVLRFVGSSLHPLFLRDELSSLSRRWSKSFEIPSEAGDSTLAAPVEGGDVAVRLRDLTMPDPEIPPPQEAAESPGEAQEGEKDAEAEAPEGKAEPASESLWDETMVEGSSAAKPIEKTLVESTQETSEAPEAPEKLGEEAESSGELEILAETLQIDLDEASAEFEEETLESMTLPAAEAGAGRPSISARVLFHLQRRRYFLPELRSAFLRCWREALRAYSWLHERRFFWPKIQACARWAIMRAAENIRWVRDEQEWWVWLRPYQGKGVGYYALSGKKAPAIRLLPTHRAEIEKIHQFTPKEVLRVIKGIQKSEKWSKEERETLTQLKDCVVMREKTLLQPETILDIINYGHQKFLKIMRKTGALTNAGKVNRRLTEYFQALLEGPIEDAPRVFRKGLETCSAHMELKAFLGHYPLYRRSTLERHKSLAVILQVKNVVEEFERRPHNLVRIMNRHLGPTGEVNVRRQLEQLLANSFVYEQLWELVSGERNLESMLRILRKLPKKAACRPAAESMVQLTTAFLEGDAKFTFTEFQASLNFAPSKLQKKICGLVKRRLQDDLSKKVNALLPERGNFLQRWETLRQILTSPRSQGAGLSLFGYLPEEIAKRIDSLQELQTSAKQVRHALSNPQIPENLVHLIVQARKAKASAMEKNIPNCARMLEKVQVALDGRERVNLRPVLSAIFKLHGEVDFSASQGQPIPGYELAVQIERFYADPKRTTLKVGESVVPEIRALVQKMVDGERKRQLEQMARYREIGSTRS